VEHEEGGFGSRMLYIRYESWRHLGPEARQLPRRGRRVFGDQQQRPVAAHPPFLAQDEIR